MASKYASFKVVVLKLNFSINIFYDRKDNVYESRTSCVICHGTILSGKKTNVQDSKILIKSLIRSHLIRKHGVK